MELAIALPANSRALVAPLAAALLLAPLTSHAGTGDKARALLDALSRRGRATRSLSGTFVQTKRLALFSSDVVSRGRFSVRRRAGRSAAVSLRWVTIKPSPSELRLDGDRVELRAPGARTRVMSLARAPRFAGLLGDLLSWLGASGKRAAASALATRYAAVATVDGALRRLTLSPRVAALRKRLSRVVLWIDASDDTRRVRIVERNGDTTDIRFGGLARTQGSSSRKGGK